MAVDIHMKIDGVKGEAQDATHKDEIDVLSWNWGMSQSGTRHTGGGGGGGKVDVHNLSFVKYVDRATTDLMLSCCNGKAIPAAELTVRKAGDDPLEYLKIKMTDCLVSDVHSGGSGSENRLTETVTLNFAKVEVEYTPQKADGSGDASTKMGWDIAKNQRA
jgi:type VI secretion system secreted protein Hcp